MPRLTILLLVLCLPFAILRAEHWAFQPLVRPELPAVDAAHPIDRFIVAEAEASRERLIRRATLDLTGLPPTIAEIDAFLADDVPGAYERLIDRLLASPHYGERWGRHWLDVARYVQGAIKVDGINRIDMAEPYRDYVVRAFNQDKPYGRFLTEQLAGDLLPKPAETAARFDQMVAPAFLAIGPWFDECTDPNKLRLDIIDEQMSTLTKAVLGLDFACARCHDHKFDPIPTRDYYALAGILRSTQITAIGPMLARPGDPGNGVALADIGDPVRIDIAYGGSCTAGKREDFDHYHAVAEWALQNGKRVAPGVKLYLQCGTLQVREYCIEKGYLDTFRAIGAEMLQPACGACGQCGPGVTERADQVTISAINRNFPGRGGPGQVWLASPPTVVASAIAGRIASFDDLMAQGRD